MAVRSSSARVGAGRRRPRLSATEWIEAAFAVLARTGADGMRIDDIAAELNCTKGSFYWHFADRPSLLRAMADHWAQRTADLLVGVAEIADTDERFRRIHEQALVVAPADRAMRHWARTDPDVAVVVAKADDLIHQFLVQAFTDVGFPRAEAELRAKVQHLSFIGQYVTHVRLSPEDHQALRAILDGQPARRRSLSR